MKFLKFAHSLSLSHSRITRFSLTYCIKSNVLCLAFISIILHLIYWTVFPSLPRLFPISQNFDSCQVTALIFVFFFFNQSTVFKAILKPNLNSFNWQQCSWRQSLSPFEILQHSKTTGLIWYLYRSSVPHHSHWALQLQDHRLFIFTFVSIIPNTPSAPLSILNILRALTYCLLTS